MLSFNTSTHQFNFRVAGILCHRNRVLIHRAVAEDFWTLPGGRVEAGETSTASLAREFREELSIDVQVESLAAVVENFFNYQNRDYHELCLVFRLSANETGQLHHHAHEFVGNEPGFEFAWADLNRLDEWRLLPECLPALLNDGFVGVRHVVQRDSD